VNDTVLVDTVLLNDPDGAFVDTPVFYLSA
jgi:hypothetical protein